MPRPLKTSPQNPVMLRNLFSPHRLLLTVEHGITAEDTTADQGTGRSRGGLGTTTRAATRTRGSGWSRGAGWRRHRGGGLRVGRGRVVVAGEGPRPGVGWRRFEGAAAARDEVGYGWGMRGMVEWTDHGGKGDGVSDSRESSRDGSRRDDNPRIGHHHRGHVT